jgi:CSLREA domain-containing protein
MRTNPSRLLMLLLSAALLLASVAPALAQEPLPPIPPDEPLLEAGALPVVASAAGTAFAPGPVADVPEGVVAAAPDQAHISFNVNVYTLVDEGDLDPNTAPGTKCSLREALQAGVPTETPFNQGCGKPPKQIDDLTINLMPGTYLLTARRASRRRSTTPSAARCSTRTNCS